jgi:putative toxin-antitoxin system antitoxin component (TIGR02293 family)
VEQGLPRESLQLLRAKGLTDSEISDVVISRAALQRRLLAGKELSTLQSDRVVRLVRILERAVMVFANQKKALGWLRSEDRRIGRTRLHLATTEVGGRLLEEMLVQIDEGIYV